MLKKNCKIKKSKLQFNLFIIEVFWISPWVGKVKKMDVSKVQLALDEDWGLFEQEVR